MARYTSFVLIATVALAAPSITRADPGTPTAADIDRAAELFKNAKALHAKGKLVEARDTYGRAWALHRSPDIAANLAACELALNELRSAAEHFDFALRHMLAGTTPEQKARLVEGFEKARKGIAVVRLEVKPEGAAVLLDGSNAGTAPLTEAVFVEPGERKVRVEKPGYEPYVGSFAVQKGETKTVRIVLEASATGSAPGAGTTAPAGAALPGGNGSKSGPTGAAGDTGTRGQSAVPAYAAIGAGVLGLGAGIGFLVAASGKESDKDALLDEIAGSNKCGSQSVAAGKCAEAIALADDAKRYRTFGYVGFGVAAAGGVLAYLLWPRSPGTGTGTMILPNIRARGSSLHVQGTF
ncbi:MAG: PEGA domain-containing protein [Polyangiaceae bacterium]|nr:PEGA domain-containing protein [Polyangiaceae bacterium]